MAHRLHIVVSSNQYAFLTDESKRSSVSMGELIRRALDSTYGPGGTRRVHVITHTLGRRSGVRFTE